jgi:hypothetical protein
MKKLILIQSGTCRTFKAYIALGLVMACFVLLPGAQAVTPAPDGAYPGYNTAEGLNALLPAIPGVWNTAIGAYALSSSAPGGLGNTAVGLNSLRHNTTGDFNNALGVNSLLFNSIGSQNVAIGNQALDLNTTASHNTGVGFQALFANNADDNTAVGYQALRSNTGGTENTATGRQALFHNTGGANTANGANALFTNTAGGGNTAIGFSALGSSTGFGNIGLGFLAGNGVTTASGVICIGASGANVNNRTYIGNIGGFSQPPAIGTVEFVTVDLATGLLGHNASSRRYKEDIEPMGKASELLYQLKPVTYRFKKNVENPTPNLDYGLIAEDVAEIDPELAVRDGKGQIESVRYLAIYNMMLNEFLKEHQTVQELKSTVEKQEAIIAQQQKGMEVLTAQLKEQAAQIQKVSAQIEVSKPAPQVAVSNQ